ncbi:helix-turn-helix transcriptional regulator [Mediterranea massiliensis]|uniref:response regulator transcription factor n=1 Tax=Mediterranea massiliensis TaxID=1841865 RepID=UPI00320B3F53
MGHHGTHTILTVRESEVAERIAWGASQKEVATELGISRYTVDNILRKVYDKLHIGKINELSAWWFCTTFGISFDLSPLKRAIGACCLLGIFMMGEFFNKEQFCRYRTRRIARTEYRINEKL